MACPMETDAHSGEWIKVEWYQVHDIPALSRRYGPGPSRGQSAPPVLLETAHF